MPRSVGAGATSTSGGRVATIPRVSSPADEERSVAVADAMMRALDALERLADAVTILSSAMADGERTDLGNARRALEALGNARARADDTLSQAQACAESAITDLAQRAHALPPAGAAAGVPQKTTRGG